MADYRIDFDSPWYLLLLGLLPIIWWFSYRGLAGLGPVRRLVVITLRSLMLALVVLALAEIQWVRANHRVTVIYLIDQSESIPAEQRAAMRRYVREEVDLHRRDDDRAGVIVFGKDAAVEIPPIDDLLPLADVEESNVDPQHTNLASAMRLAQATFPEDAARRVVIVTDGNQNLGDALAEARSLAAAGIGIDVVPVFYQARAEVAVEKVSLPSEVRKDQPFQLRVVLSNSADPKSPDGGVVSGRLIVTQQSDDEPVVLSEEHIDLPPGTTVKTLSHQLDAASPYTYEARFVPDRPQDDAMVQNNRATAFTQVRGSGQVLLIEDSENQGEFKPLADRMKQQGIEVSLRPSNQAFNDLSELQQFDTVVLGNVPREEFSDDQIRALVANTEQMGCGLIMLGGPNSFGAGGWTNTELEKAMPLDFQIKSAKVSPQGALVMVMHASELPQGNYWQKVISQEAVKTLGNADYCGVLHFDGTDKWLWNPPQGVIRVGGSRQRMLARLDGMVPGDMPQFDPSLIMARNSLSQLTTAAIKHMVVISDGDPQPPSPNVVRSLVRANITVSTVAVGTHGPAGSLELQQLARATQGKYYEVRNPRALPRIFQREARYVATPLIYDMPPPFSPQITTDHEMVRGIEPVLPPISGFVMTSVKENPLVEVSLVSPRPANTENNSILASWTYGLGKAVCLTTDAGARWATSWTSWDGYDKLFSQIFRWSMRALGEQGKFSVSTDYRDGRVHVVVNSLDPEGAQANLLDMNAAAIGPDMKPEGLELQQSAPGRYVGSFATDKPGSHFIVIAPGPGISPLRVGVTVPYSDEFRARETDANLLRSLASLAPRGGRAGKVIEGPDLQAQLQTNTFRHDLPRARRSQEAWFNLVLIAGCLFFFDVFVRRVAISFAWVRPATAWVRTRVLGKPASAPSDEYLKRLRGQKAAVVDEISQQRAAARFELPENAPAQQDALTEQPGGAASSAEQPAKPADQGLAPEDESESYTARLLKAKEQARRDRESS